MRKPKTLSLIGWREWCVCSQLDIPAIKAKIDTGAKTSSLHAANIVPFKKGDNKYVRFLVHPLQGHAEVELECEALVIDYRGVMSSNGHIENRYVIRVEMQLGTLKWPIDLTLSNRDPLKFRMLLGRDALSGHFMIDPYRSYLQGKFSQTEVRQFYQEMY
ncbi:MAG: ATP-dependent zinc protease [Waddliaceae bacterium]|nr:ATP-dependent zinc protease [Waddliaceae bacterium]